MDNETTASGEPAEATRKVDQEALESLAAFTKAMRDEAIPEIVRIVEERRLVAAKTRQLQLKC